MIFDFIFLKYKIENNDIKINQLIIEKEQLENRLKLLISKLKY